MGGKCKYHLSVNIGDHPGGPEWSKNYNHHPHWVFWRSACTIYSPKDKNSMIFTPPFFHVHFLSMSLGSNNKLTRTVLNTFEGLFIIAWRRSPSCRSGCYCECTCGLADRTYIQRQHCPRRLQIEASSLITTRAFCRTQNSKHSARQKHRT